LTSGVNRDRLVCFVIAPTSQGKEPPTIPGRFSKRFREIFWLDGPYGVTQGHVPEPVFQLDRTICPDYDDPAIRKTGVEGEFPRGRFCVKHCSPTWKKAMEQNAQALNSIVAVRARSVVEGLDRRYDFIRWVLLASAITNDDLDSALR
jgi:hypothetical protein